MTEPTRLDAEHLFSLTLEVGDAPHGIIRNGPTGHRFIAPVTGGSFQGPELRGTVVPPGGDWVHRRPNKTVRLDVRLLLVTDDNESILMTYQGIGTPQGDGGLSARTAPMFETGSERYAWLNDVQAVGIGALEGDTIHYDVYRLL